MATTRTRGRRPTPDARKVKLHEEAIADALKKRAAVKDDLAEAERELAEAINAAIDDSVATKDITVWIGVSRQMVNKMLSKLDTPSRNGKPPAPRKRPGPPGKG